MEQSYKYKAFISYRHNERDRAVAMELQKKLERYKPPKSERNKGESGKWRVFRDETELNTSHSLSEEIIEALKQSEYLITICSEDYNQSEWCLEELRQFKEIHHGSNDKIIAVLSDGSPELAFPAELRTETVAETDEDGNVTYREQTVTPLAANMRAETVKERNKKMKTEFLRVAAPLLGSDYDTLFQRWQRRKLRNIFAIGGTALAILLAFSIVSGTLLWKISTQQKEIVRQTEIAIANEQIAKENEEQAKKNEEIAKENETRAQENANRAEENADRAEANFKQAKKNEKQATANAEEARENARQAEENEKIAKENAKRAEENFAIAKENESRANANAKAANEERDRANTENRNTRIKNAEILTTQAEMYLENGEIVSSLQTAKQAMPIGENKDLPQNPAAEKVMHEAMNLYGEPEDTVRDILYRQELSANIEKLKYSSDGTRLMVYTYDGNIHIINTETQKIIRTVYRREYTKENGFAVLNVQVDQNTGYVLMSDCLLSLNLTDGTVNWRFASSDSRYYLKSFAFRSDSDVLFVAENSAFYFLNKQGEVISQSPELKKDSYKLASSDNVSYMDASGNVYILPCDTSDSLYRIRKGESTAEKILLNLTYSAKDGVFGEYDGKLYLEILDMNTPRVICLNPSDMSEIWNVELPRNEYSSSNRLTDICQNILFYHRYNSYTSLAVVAEKRLCELDAETGALKLETNIDGSNILFLDHNPDTKKMLVCTGEGFYEKSYGMYDWEKAIKTFDTRKGVAAYAEGKLYFAGSADAELALWYRETFPPVGECLTGVEVKSSLNTYADDGNGLLAIGSGSYSGNLILYQMDEKRVVSVTETKKIEEMHFAADKLFVLMDSKTAEVYGKDGYSLASIDLKSCLGTYQKEIYVWNGTVYVASDYDGIVAFDLKDDAFEPQRILDDSNDPRRYAFADGVVYYFEESDDDLIYCSMNLATGKKTTISESGKTVRYSSDSIDRVAASKDGKTAAFVSLEGFIGVCRNHNLRRISYPKEQSDVAQLLLTPDGTHLLILQESGTVVRYSTETSEVMGTYRSNVAVKTGHSLKTMGNDAFVAGENVVVDIGTMQERVRMEDAFYVTEGNHAFLASYYQNGKNALFRYDILSTEEVLQKTDEYLAKFGQ